MEIKKKILEFLDRNLVLEDSIVREVRWNIDDLSDEQLTWVYNVLIDLDKKQTQALQDKLEEDPNFFFKMETEVFKEMYNKHIKEEQEEKKFIENWLKQQLS